MNFQYRPILEPIKVFVINPLTPASQLIIVKIMSGVVFGKHQLIDLYLIVYSNEMMSANAFRLEIESCAFSCTNSIKVSSDLPSASDVDVFCFLTNFNNPNHLDVTKEEYLKDQLDSLYLIIKLANNFKWSDNAKKSEVMKSVNFDDKKAMSPKIPYDIKRKPIFIADGFVAMDILMSLSENMPPDVFFCPTSLTGIAKTVLGDYLNVQCNAINDVHVWAANDEVFHVEVEKPLIVNDVVADESRSYKSDTVGKNILESRNLDTTQFNNSWMKKEFIEKVASSASKNPYGCIYRAAEFTKTLRDIWLTRIRDDGKRVCNNIGIISDGSYGTIKGCPYVLPIIFDKGVRTINNRFVDDTHVKQEIKRINKAVKNHHEQLIPYCKKFLQDNVINQPFRNDEDSVFLY